MSESDNSNNKKQENKTEVDNKNDKLVDADKFEDVDVPADFKKKVIQFLDCDDTIKELQKKIKEFKAKKETCEEYIIDNLDKLDTTMIEVKGSKLIKNKSETKGPCKTDIIKETLDEELKDPKKVKRILEKMEEKRELKERVFLKRTNGQPKKLKKEK